MTMKNGNKEYFNLILREQSVALNNAITTEKKHMNAVANNTDFVNTTGFPSTYLCWAKFIRLKKYGHLVQNQMKGNMVNTCICRKKAICTKIALTHKMHDAARNAYLFHRRNGSWKIKQKENKSIQNI